MIFGLLPQPQKVERHNGVFALPESGVIAISGGGLYAVARELQTLFPAFKIHASYADSDDTVSVALCADLPPQGYKLTVTPSGICIEAGAEAGAFYAVETLRQLVACAEESTLPAMEIEDWPDFADRGVSYDISRGESRRLKP